MSPFAFAALLDGQIVEVFHSPYIVPVAGCAMIGCIAVAGIWSGVRTRELQSQERLARLAHGLPPEPDWDAEALRQAGLASPPAPATPKTATGRVNDGSNARRAGLILCAIGVGLILFFAFLAVAVQVREVLSGAAAGILPLAIGIGFLVDATLRRREYEDRLAAASFGAASFQARTGHLAPDFPSTAYPPPPVSGSYDLAASPLPPRDAEVPSYTRSPLH